MCNRQATNKNAGKIMSHSAVIRLLMQQVGAECEWQLTEKSISTVAAAMHMQVSVKKKRFHLLGSLNSDPTPLLDTQRI